MLQVNNLTISRANRILAMALGFMLKPGELLYVKGPNGVGKTTLLRTLCGLYQPDEGDILWQGQAVSQNKQAFFQDLLFIGHKAAVNDSLTAKENFFYLTEGLFSDEEMNNALANMNLNDLEGRAARTFSAGQKRRVALAQLFLAKERLWILDEPLTALDSDGVALVESAMDNHLKQNGMIVVTSHQPLSFDVKPENTIAMQAE